VGLCEFARGLSRAAIREKEDALMHQPSSPTAMSTRDLLREIASNGSLLIKRQVKLAQLEGRRNLSQEKTAIEFLGSGGIVGYAAAILFLVAAALGIGDALDGRYWAGALIVGGALLAIAAILATIGWVQRVRKPLRRTRREIDKELSWANTQLTT
jgi:hypothetical protein